MLIFTEPGWSTVQIWLFFWPKRFALYPHSSLRTLTEPERLCAVEKPPHLWPKPLLGKRGEIAPLSAPPHTRLYSKEVIVTYLVIHFMINSPSCLFVLGLLRRVVIRLSISSFSFSEQKCSKIENGSC